MNTIVVLLLATLWHNAVTQVIAPSQLAGCWRVEISSSKDHEIEFNLMVADGQFVDCYIEGQVEVFLEVPFKTWCKTIRQQGNIIYISADLSVAGYSAEFGITLTPQSASRMQGTIKFATLLDEEDPVVKSAPYKHCNPARTARPTPAPPPPTPPPTPFPTPFGAIASPTPVVAPTPFGAIAPTPFGAIAPTPFGAIAPTPITPQVAPTPLNNQQQPTPAPGADIGIILVIFLLICILLAAIAVAVAYIVIYRKDDSNSQDSVSQQQMYMPGQISGENHSAMMGANNMDMTSARHGMDMHGVSIREDTQFVRSVPSTNYVAVDASSNGGGYVTPSVDGGTGYITPGGGSSTGYITPQAGSVASNYNMDEAAGQYGTLSPLPSNAPDTQVIYNPAESMHKANF